MSFINYSSREINCKIVYYGPGLCGKTTNLQYIYNKTNPETKGKLISLSTETDRTLFFDFLPLSLGEIRGFKTRFHLYTVPGQVFYDASRKLILKGVDGVVFVADSQVERMEANMESFENLRINLGRAGLRPEQDPERDPVQQAGPAQRGHDRGAAQASLNPRNSPRVPGGGPDRRRRVRHIEGGGEAGAHRAEKGRLGRNPLGPPDTRSPGVSVVCKDSVFPSREPSLRQGSACTPRSPHADREPLGPRAVLGLAAGAPATPAPTPRPAPERWPRCARATSPSRPRRRSASSGSGQVRRPRRGPRGQLLHDDGHPGEAEPVRGHAPRGHRGRGVHRRG